jgi:hypothetical protein
MRACSYTLYCSGVVHCVDGPVGDRPARPCVKQDQVQRRRGSARQGREGVYACVRVMLYVRNRPVCNCCVDLYILLPHLLVYCLFMLFLVSLHYRRFRVVVDYFGRQKVARMLRRRQALRRIRRRNQGMLGSDEYTSIKRNTRLHIAVQYYHTGFYGTNTTLALAHTRST